MRRKGSWKQLFAAMLTAALLAVAPEGVTAMDNTEVGWNYEDSILVHIIVDEPREFSPKDFAVIDCEKVYVMEKIKRDSGVEYQLALQLDRWGDEELEEAIKIVSGLPMVVQAKRNTENIGPASASVLTLNHSYLYLAVGETKDVSIDYLEIKKRVYYDILGIMFEPDPAYFNMDLLQKDSFQQFGISRFWPDIFGTGYLILLPYFQKADQEGKKSETGYYYGLAGDDNQHLFETMSALAADPGISYVSVCKSLVVGAASEYEKWIVANPEILSCSLSGGEIQTNGQLINQTATVKGEKPGVTTLTCERYGGGYASNTCTAIIYEPGSKNNPGDINHDGTISAEDALQALKHTVGLELLDENGKQTADLNDDGAVNVEDALLMLKIAIGSL